jgi:Kef-type K+ transport system membrane component KefB
MLMPESQLAAGGPSRSRFVVLYGFLIVGAVGAFLGLTAYGERQWPALHPTTPALDESFPHVSELFHLLLALVVVALTGRALASGLRRLQQPPVMGEILAGICLGPSLLGHLAPRLAHFILPEATAPYLGLLSQVGVMFFMFAVGVELNPAALRKQASSLLAISYGSIAVPFLLGGALALFLYPRMASPADASFTIFALFSGIAVAVTAFPVLSRILTDRGISRSPLGVLALACASVNDATAWCLLAVILGAAKANLTLVAWTLGLAALYVLVMLLVVEPAVARFVRRHDAPLGAAGLALVVAGILLSALLTDLIGIHAIFGAFLLGALVPHDSRMGTDLVAKIEPLVGVLLLPAFFAFTGMRTQLGLLSGTTDWLLCGLIILVASLGKFGGSYVPARLSGMGWRDSAALGILLNTRGLMELIVLNIGLDMRIISPKLFTMYVFMALATTFATTPIFDRLLSRRPAEV